MTRVAAIDECAPPGAAARGFSWSGARELLAAVLRCSPSRFTLALLLCVTVGVTEGLILTLLIPMLNSVGVDTGGGGISSMTRGLNSVFAALSLTPSLPAVLICFAASTLLHEALYRWRAVVIERVHQDLQIYMRRELYAAIVAASWEFFVRQKRYEVGQALTQEVEKLQAAACCLLMLVTNLSVGCAYCLLGLTVSWRMTAVACLAGAVLGALLHRSIRLSRHAGEAVTRAAAALSATAGEHLNAVKAVKSYGSEARSSSIFTAAAAEMREAGLRMGSMAATARFAFKAGATVTMCSILYVAIELLHLGAADLLFLIVLFFRILPKFNDAFIGLVELVRLLPAIDRVAGMVAAFRSHAEPPAEFGDPIAIRREVRLHDISYRYTPEGPLVLDELALVLPAGTTRE